MQKKVIVIGAGISGLTAAFYIKKLAKDVSVTLLEASDRLGGKIKTVRKFGFTIECGPEGYMARKPALTELIREVGLGDQLVNSKSGSYSIYVNHRLRPMPKGSVMGIPTKLLPMVTTGLISPLGKIRAAMDLVLPRVYQNKDMSLAEFFGRRLGQEVITNMIAPLLSGIYNGDLADMSLEATLPQFAGIEQKHRSLILGMKHIQPPKQVGVSKKKAGQLLSLSCGMDVLVEKLADAIDDIRLNAPVRHVQTGRVEMEDGTVLKADAIIVAAAPKQLGPLLDFPEAWALSHDKRTSTATVALAFKKKDIAAVAGSTGFVVSKKEGLSITACSWMNHKWANAAPDDCTLVRSYIGTETDPKMAEETDEAIVNKVLFDLRKIIEVGTPLFSVVTRQMDNMPQYTVGHNQRVQEFEAALGKISGVYACGAILHGVGVPDCVDNAKRAAEQAVAALTE